VLVLDLDGMADITPDEQNGPYGSILPHGRTPRLRLQVCRKGGRLWRQSA
jgi:hypothetical protein